MRLDGKVQCSHSLEFNDPAKRNVFQMKESFLFLRVCSAVSPRPPRDFTHTHTPCTHSHTSTGTPARAPQHTRPPTLSLITASIIIVLLGRFLDIFRLDQAKVFDTAGDVTGVVVGVAGLGFFGGDLSKSGKISCIDTRKG